MITVPCKDCTERHLNCHSSCQKYSEFKQAKDNENAMKKQDCRENSYDIERMLRLKKHKGR